MHKLIGVLMLTTIAACSGQSGAASPEAAVGGVVAAARAYDAAKAASFFPTPEALAEVLDCPADAPLLRRVVELRAGLADELPGMGQVAFIRRESDSDMVRSFAAGDAVDACRAKGDLAVLRTRIVFGAAGGREESDMMRFIQLGGRFYLTDRW